MLSYALNQTMKSQSMCFTFDRFYLRPLQLFYTIEGGEMPVLMGTKPRFGAM